jgi:transposase InsO family protein
MALAPIGCKNIFSKLNCTAYLRSAVTEHLGHWQSFACHQAKRSYMIKDDLSGYVWLIPSQGAYAATVLDALLSWFAAFGVSMTWVSDQGSHFKNTVLEDVRRALRSRHHFTTAYSP